MSLKRKADGDDHQQQEDSSTKLDFGTTLPVTELPKGVGSYDLVVGLTKNGELVCDHHPYVYKGKEPPPTMFHIHVRGFVIFPNKKEVSAKITVVVEKPDMEFSVSEDKSEKQSSLGKLKKILLLNATQYLHALSFLKNACLANAPYFITSSAPSSELLFRVSDLGVYCCNQFGLEMEFCENNNTEALFGLSSSTCYSEKDLPVYNPEALDGIAIDSVDYELLFRRYSPETKAIANQFRDKVVTFKDNSYSTKPWLVCGFTYRDCPHGKGPLLILKNEEGRHITHIPHARVQLLE